MRPNETTIAATRKIEPTRRSNRRIANAIASEALAWSDGNDGSWERLPHTCAVGWVAKGRGRAQIFVITCATRSARPADARADAEASFHFRGRPGRSRSHSAMVASANSGTAHFSMFAAA